MVNLQDVASHIRGCRTNDPLAKLYLVDLLVVICICLAKHLVGDLLMNAQWREG
jgi:hypothetical protein